MIFPSEISSRLSTYLENGAQFSSLLLCACRVLVVDDTTMLGTIAIYGLLSTYLAARCMLQPAGLVCDCSRQNNNAQHNCYLRHFLHLVVVVFVLCRCFCTKIDVVLLLKWVLWAPPIIDCFELHLPKNQ